MKNKIISISMIIIGIGLIYLFIYLMEHSEMHQQWWFAPTIGLNTLAYCACIAGGITKLVYE